MGTKYSQPELKAHRDQWWKHCESHSDEPFGLFLDVSFKAIFRSAAVHRYRLIVTYKNTSKEAQDGWKLKVLFPSFVPLFPVECDRCEVSVDGERYIKLESCSNDRVFPDELVEVVPHNVHLIEYEVNDDVHRRLRMEHKVMWQLFTPRAPVIEGEKSLMELQEF